MALDGTREEPGWHTLHDEAWLLLLLQLLDDEIRCALGPLAQEDLGVDVSVGGAASWGAVSHRSTGLRRVALTARELDDHDSRALGIGLREEVVSAVLLAAGACLVFAVASLDSFLAWQGRSCCGLSLAPLLHCTVRCCKDTDAANAHRDALGWRHDVADVYSAPPSLGLACPEVIEAVVHEGSSKAHLGACAYQSPVEVLHCECSWGRKLGAQAADEQRQLALEDGVIDVDWYSSRGSVM